MTVDPISSTRYDCKTGWCREPTECKAFGGCRYHFVVASESEQLSRATTLALIKGGHVRSSAFTAVSRIIKERLDSRSPCQVASSANIKKE